MPTTRPVLDAAHRDVTGKAVAKLRRAGRIPAVVFGHGVPSANVSLDAHEFELLRRHVAATTLVDLKVDGKKPRPVLVHGVQVDRLTRRPVHVDLFVVKMTEELTMDVPLHATGIAPAVDLHGGTLLHVIETLKVRALPDHLPQAIEYPLDGLADLDATIHVRDLRIPTGVQLLADPDEIVAKVLPPRVEVEEVAPAPAVEAAPVAEVAAGAAPAEEAAPAEG